MDDATLQKLTEFVAPYYAAKDELHGLGHVGRLLAGALELAEGAQVDEQLLTLGAYFHGIVYTHETAIRNFLAALGLERGRIDQAVRVAWESWKESRPESREGALLHDAHLIEGGKAFGITKSLVVGALRGQTLEETLDFIESDLLGRFTCATEKARAVFAEQEQFTREFVAQLRRALARGRLPS